MIADERLAAYINSLDTGNTEILDRIEAGSKGGRGADHPQGDAGLFKAASGNEKAGAHPGGWNCSRLLRCFDGGVYAGSKRRSLRLRIMKSGFRSPVRISVGRAKRIRFTLLEGDAAELLPTLEGTFDFIFMDAAKGQYIHFLPEILRLLAPDGILVSDNVLQDGDILESRFIVTRRNRTIHKRMREYLYVLTHHESLPRQCFR